MPGVGFDLLSFIAGVGTGIFVTIAGVVWLVKRHTKFGVGEEEGI